MPTGRTVAKFARVYIDGNDMSGFSRNIGPLRTVFDQDEGTVFNDPVKGAFPGHVSISPGTLTGNFDNTATVGLHVVASGAGVKRDVMVNIGIQAVPAIGDPCFMSQPEQTDYKAEPTTGSLVAATIEFGEWANLGDTLLYERAWGQVQHALGAETAANTAIGIDHVGGAATTKGGFMMYHATTSNGTATLKMQDADTNLDGSFGDLVSSGVIDPSSGALSALVPLGTTATVKQFLRWQLLLGTATTITFTIGFVRG